MQLNLYFIVWYDNNEDDFICEKQWQRTNEDWFHKYSCRSSRASEIFLPASHGHVCDCGASQSAGRRGPSLRVFSPLSTNDWRWFLLQLLLDWKSPTLAPLARCGSGCSRSVKRLVERKLSPTSSEWTSSRATPGVDSWTLGTTRRIRQPQHSKASASSSTARLRPAITQLCSTGSRSDCHDDGICEG